MIRGPVRTCSCRVGRTSCVDLQDFSLYLERRETSHAKATDSSTSFLQHDQLNRLQTWTQTTEPVHDENLSHHRGSTFPHSAAMAVVQRPDEPPWTTRTASSITIGAVGFLCRSFLYAFNRTETFGLDNFLRILDSRKDPARRERGLITGE